MQELSVRASVASRDALQVLKRALTDPVGNIGAFGDVLGERRVLDAGIALVIAFDLAMVVAVQIGARKTLGFLAPLVFGESAFVALIKSMLFAAVPALVLMAVLLSVQKIFGGRAEIARALFAAGVTLIPIALVSLLAAILGAANFEIIAILGVALISYTALILFAALRDVLGVGSGKAAALLTVVFLVTGWLSKVVVAALL
ncbi:MAG TPA: YIP1 family protein [Thermoanaerobaculia bacterium]|nr:YIP1 family protein [Thermoanaerobaculia bacterium]